MYSSVLFCLKKVWNSTNWSFIRSRKIHDVISLYLCTQECLLMQWRTSVVGWISFFMTVATCSICLKDILWHVISNPLDFGLHLHGANELEGQAKACGLPWVFREPIQFVQLKGDHYITFVLAFSSYIMGHFIGILG